MAQKPEMKQENNAFVRGGTGAPGFDIDLKSTEHSVILRLADKTGTAPPRPISKRNGDMADALSARTAYRIKTY
jgi:hypothetical protein